MRKDYNVQGNINDIEVKGIVKSYPKNLKEAHEKGSKCSVLSSLETKNNTVNYESEQIIKK